MHIIMGLGNPGEKYSQTRHNAGFLAVTELARKHNVSWKENKKFKAEIAEGTDFILVKPLTFMNDSGQTALAILSYYKLIPKNIFGIKKETDLSSVLTVIQDELDLPLGGYKVSNNSGAAGHNGILSIINYLKIKNFKRIRIGISTEAKKQIPGDKFVLQRFNEEELKQLNEVIQKIISEI